MEFDYSKLRGRIIEKYGTYTAFAEAANIERQTLSAKLSGEIGIPSREIVLWCTLLDISLSELGVFFYTQKVKQV